MRPPPRDFFVPARRAVVQAGATRCPAALAGHKAHVEKYWTGRNARPGINTELGRTNPNLTRQAADSDRTLT